MITIDRILDKLELKFTINMIFGEEKYFIVIFSTSRKQLYEGRTKSYKVDITIDWEGMQEKLNE